MNKREPTMSRALSMLEDGATIVETGCARLPDDGQSTLVFGRWAAEHKGYVWSVDIDPDIVTGAAALTAGYPVTFALGDSVDFLAGFGQPIDLLYLDSFDYPYGALLDLYGGKTDIEAAIADVALMSEAAIVAAHGDLIGPAQRHAEREIIAALPYLTGPVLIDDADLAGGGKARLARVVLAEHGFRCIADAYQTLWAR